MISDPVAAARALLVGYAQDTYSSAPRELAPPLDERAAIGLDLVGHLVAQDAVLRAGSTSILGEDTCYGYLARNKANTALYVAVVRGTANMVEWVEDAQFIPRSHPGGAGRVESGFWDIYATMRYVPATGVPVPAAQGIAAAVGAGSVTVVGHSLGAAIATYLAYDLSALADTTATLLGSPQPGDATFAERFDERVGAARYNTINRIVDIVPHVPFGPDYTHLPHRIWLWPKEEQVRVRFGPLCNHHWSTYAGVLHYATLQASKVIAVDHDDLVCIKGFNL